MPRVNVVAHARKPQGQCGKCGVKINKGDPYRWWKFRYGGRRVRCMKAECSPRPSDLTSSDKISTLLAAAEDFTAELAQALDDLKSDLESSGDEAENVGSEYSDSASNVGEYFSGSEQESNLEDMASSCEEWSGTLRDAAGEFDFLPEAGDPGGPEMGDQLITDFIQITLDDGIQEDDLLDEWIDRQCEAWDEWWEELKSEIDNAITNAEDAAGQVPESPF
jgi:hypothetical protein